MIIYLWHQRTMDDRILVMYSSHIYDCNEPGHMAIIIINNRLYTNRRERQKDPSFATENKEIVTWEWSLEHVFFYKRSLWWARAHFDQRFEFKSITHLSLVSSQLYISLFFATFGILINQYVIKHGCINVYFCTSVLSLNYNFAACSKSNSSSSLVPGSNSSIEISPSNFFIKFDLSPSISEECHSECTVGITNMGTCVCHDSALYLFNWFQNCKGALTRWHLYHESWKSENLVRISMNQLRINSWHQCYLPTGNHKKYGKHKRFHGSCSVFNRWIFVITHWTRRSLARFYIQNEFDRNLLLYNSPVAIFNPILDMDNNSFTIYIESWLSYEQLNLIDIDYGQSRWWSKWQLNLSSFR